MDTLSGKVLFCLILGTLLGVLVGMAMILFGLAANPLIIPVWTVVGALFGTVHAIGELVRHFFEYLAALDQKLSGDPD